jgi:ArsR family transcriptional regulator, arsenate/arsenite/antimonite-responsive transcriptional repressor
MNRVFAALSDPTRRSILSMLSRGEKSAGEIAEAFAITRPSISHHLSVLKGADLIESRREGQSLIYSIHTTVLEDALASFLGLLRAGEPRPEQDERGKT